MPALFRVQCASATPDTAWFSDIPTAQQHRLALKAAGHRPAPVERFDVEFNKADLVNWLNLQARGEAQPSPLKAHR